MPLQVVDRDQGDAKAEGEAAGETEPDQKGSGKAGAVGNGERIESAFLGSGFRERRRHGSAKTAGAAGHQRGSAVEPERIEDVSMLQEKSPGLVPQRLLPAVCARR